MVLATSGAACGGSSSAAEHDPHRLGEHAHCDPDDYPAHDPFENPCETDDDCGECRYCTVIRGGMHTQDAPQDPSPLRYCVRHNSGDCCPP